MDKVKQLAEKISSSKYLRRTAKSLRVFGLVRTINMRTLNAEETQREAVKVYDVAKMLTTAAEKRRYELVLQHLLGLYNVRAGDYNLLSHLTVI